VLVTGPVTVHDVVPVDLHIRGCPLALLDPS
jgi:coenzyme F420-reducing hydrogenase gamma subunit